MHLIALLVVLGCEAEQPVSGAPQQAASTPATTQASATQTPAPAARPRLCLELHAPYARVQLGEPLTVVASLVNCSTTTQQVEDLLAPEFGFLQVWMRPPGGEERLHRPLSRHNGRGTSAQPLAPGERLSAFVPVYVSADGWNLQQPGVYRFRAQYAIDEMKIESKPIDVTVSRPQTRAAQREAATTMSREAAMFLAGGVDDRGEGSKRLSSIQQSPQSPLAPYATLGLAIARSRDSFDPGTKTFRKGDCAGVTEQLARAIPEVKDPMLAATGTAAWVRCLRQLGRESEVDRAIATLFASHPDARNVSSVTRTLRVEARK